MSRLHRFLSAYFGISRQESNGLLVLFLLLALFLVAPWGVRWGIATFSVAGSDAAYLRDTHVLDSMMRGMEAAAQTAAAEKQTAQRNRFGTSQRTARTRTVRPGQPIPFDPNTASIDTLLQVGFPLFLARRLVNYRSKGGTFRQRADLAKLYGFPDSLYRAVYPYILLPEALPPRDSSGTFARRGEAQLYGQSDSTPPRTTTYTPRTWVQIAPFELNTASAEMLRQVHGIGEVRAERIIAQRERLGGFYHPDQVRQIYGLDQAVADSLLAVAFLDTAHLQRLRINHLDEETLRAHPYIAGNLARVLVRYRAQHGPYRSADDLRKIKILSEENLQKLLPYLDFD